MKGHISLLLLLFSTSASAIFCPTNFSSIDYGDTIDHVIEICGKPESQKVTTQNFPAAQEWEYYLKLGFFDQSMAKMTVMFKDDKVINISLVDDSVTHAQLCASVAAGQNGNIIALFCSQPYGPRNVASTNLCGSEIQLDNSPQQVQAACGKPALTRDLQDGSVQNPAVTLTEFHYINPQRVTLIFENGILKDRVF